MMVSSRYAGLNHHISSSLARTRNSIYSFKKRGRVFFRGKKGREKKNVNKSSGAVRDGREHRHQRLDICKRERERDRAIKYVNLCQSLPSFLPSYTFWSQLAFFFLLLAPPSSFLHMRSLFKNGSRWANGVGQLLMQTPASSRFLLLILAAAEILAN